MVLAQVPWYFPAVVVTKKHDIFSIGLATLVQITMEKIL
jgi:hypothetical protein